MPRFLYTDTPWFQRPVWHVETAPHHPWVWWSQTPLRASHWNTCLAQLLWVILQRGFKKEKSTRPKFPNLLGSLQQSILSRDLYILFLVSNKFRFCKGLCNLVDSAVCGLSRASDTHTHHTHNKQKNEPDRNKQWQMCLCSSVKDTAVDSTLVCFLLSLLTSFWRIYFQK